MTPPPRTLGLRHVALNVADMARAEAFYVDLLGFVVEWRPDPDNLYLRLCGDNLALHRYVAPEADDGSDARAFAERRGQRLAHFGIVLGRPADVDAWADYLRRRGVTLATAPRTHRDGARSFYVDDPEGNSIQLIYHPPISDAERGD